MQWTVHVNQCLGVPLLHFPTHGMVMFVDIPFKPISSKVFGIDVCGRLVSLPLRLAKHLLHGRNCPAQSQTSRLPINRHDIVRTQTLYIQIRLQWGCPSCLIPLLFYHPFCWWILLILSRSAFFLRDTTHRRGGFWEDSGCAYIQWGGRMKCIILALFVASWNLGSQGLMKRQKQQVVGHIFQGLCLLMVKDNPILAPKTHYWRDFGADVSMTDWNIECFRVDSTTLDVSFSLNMLSLYHKFTQLEQVFNMTGRWCGGWQWNYRIIPSPALVGSEIHSNILAVWGSTHPGATSFWGNKTSQRLGNWDAEG